ncbi:MAG TPA: hypothetical protein VGQ17_00640 [Gemmatimonadales bacterium]|jgi:hypothetical protein|nr:hypothetical protein [Gemmatimonadales bacterium]
MNWIRISTRAWLALAAVALSSCADPTPLVQDGDGDRAQGSVIGRLAGDLGLLSCSPLPYDSVTQVVGPTGGTIQVGPHELRIPPGALPHPASITAVVSPDPVNRVSFEPTGLTFLRNASLTMSYANCDLLGLLLPKRIAHVSGTLDILDYLLSVDDLTAQEVTGRLAHFSQYAIAW